MLQNQDPILNEYSNLHGISLRRTEDALIRDTILSSAAFIRSVGGNNGRHIAVIKSSLIDLEAVA